MLVSWRLLRIPLENNFTNVEFTVPREGLKNLTQYDLNSQPNSTFIFELNVLPLSHPRNTEGLQLHLLANLFSSDP